MPTRLPFDLISPRAEALSDKAAEAVSSGAPFEEVIALRMAYKKFLEESGWTLLDYDQELLKRIDARWDKPTIK